MKKPDKTIALAGNPNVGKSTVFNSLTGMHQHTGNWCGKTVSGAKGYCAHGSHCYELIDLPGAYSLTPHSSEEEVTRDFILQDNADAVIAVCDATCLERNLLFVLQLRPHCKRLLLCVNLMDEAKAKGIRIDLPLLEQLLGIPVAACSARHRKGTRELLKQLDTLWDAPQGRFPELSSAQAGELASQICRQAVACNRPDYRQRDRKLDAFFTGKYTAYPMMLALLGLVFWLTIVGANYPSALLSTLFSHMENSLARGLVQLHAPLWLQSLLTEGLLRVLSWVVSVMLPPMAIFFPMFTLLEDSGYLPRIAFNLDCPFHKCHACGKQALTMTMGLGCNAVGVTGCRIIDSPRERLIAILTNTFMPCNGRFPTLIALISMFFVGAGGAFCTSLFSALWMVGLLVISVLLTFGVSRLLSATLLKGMPSSFLLELPPYRKPQPCQVLVHSFIDRTLIVLCRAVVVALPAGLLLWVLAHTHAGSQTLLFWCAECLNPAARLLGMDGVILLAFLLGMPANEIVVPIMLMAYLSQGSLVETQGLEQLHGLLTEQGWTLRTAVCTCLFTLVHFPCTTTLLTIRRETGSLKWTALAFLIPALCGTLLCMIANGVFLLLEY